MFKKNYHNKNAVAKLYNKILLLSRNKLLYTSLKLSDTFKNRINLIFLHVSFLFIKKKHPNHIIDYKDFYQKMFDYIFNNIETNMREIGYGDTSINKNMKQLTKVFYSILLYCEKYNVQTKGSKNLFLNKYLNIENSDKIGDNSSLIKYFDKYQSFCLDLSIDCVLKGDLNFNYK